MAKQIHNPHDLLPSKIKVLDFYKGKTILITGATGFVGKVILEKIIRTCIDYKKIYVMVRGKKGVSVNDRFQKDVLNT